jgi:hypothetical protein
MGEMYYTQDNDHRGQQKKPMVCKRFCQSQALRGRKKDRK